MGDLVAVSSQNLTDIADSLRTRLESEDQFSPSEMAAAIMNITYGVKEIKGAAESSYRQGSVEMSSEDIGALPLNGTAAKATADAEGNVISTTYTRKDSVLSKGSASLPIYFSDTGEALPISSYEGNSATASKLQNAVNIQIGNTSKSFDGSAGISFSREEIGAMKASAVKDTDNNFVLEIGY